MKKRLSFRLLTTGLPVILAFVILAGNNKAYAVNSLDELQSSIPAYCNIPAPNEDCRSAETGNIYPGWRSSRVAELEIAR